MAWLGWASTISCAEQARGDRAGRGSGLRAMAHLPTGRHGLGFVFRAQRLDGVGTHTVSCFLGANVPGRCGARSAVASNGEGVPGVVCDHVLKCPDGFNAGMRRRAM